MTTESRFEHKWMGNLTAYVDYIKKNYRFPTSTTIHQGHKIGYWIRNQMNARRNGCLAEEKERLLDCFMPPWKKNQIEKKDYLEQLLKKDWATYVPSGKHSLLEIEGFEKVHNMFQLHFSDIHTCEEYITFLAKKNVAKEKLCSVYCRIYPFLSVASAMFLCVLFDIRYNDLSDPEKMEAFFLQFPYSTTADGEERIQKLLLKLSKKQRTVVEKKLGLYGEPMSYQAIGEEFQVSGEAIRQQYMKALAYLRTPKSQKFLMMTETDLDLYFLSPLTKGILYRNNIRTNEHLAGISQNDVKLKVLLNNSVNREYVLKEITCSLGISKKNTTPLERYKLSCRSYNALRRFGISNYEELLEYCGKEPEKRLLQISGLGKGSVQEICQKLGLPKQA